MIVGFRETYTDNTVLEVPDGYELVTVLDVRRVGNQLLWRYVVRPLTDA